MDLPFEAAKGTAEKLLMVRFPILMRVALPGAVSTVVLYPLTAWLLGKLPTAPDQLWQRLVACTCRSSRCP